MKIIDDRLLLMSPSSQQIVGKIYGNENSSKLLICCHGFGVKSDSRGMYNRVCEEFQNDFLTVRFHFGTIDNINNTIYVPEYSTQVEVLKTVLDNMINKYPEKEVILIAHSQGCYITSMLLTETRYKIKHLIFLSPLIRRNIVEKQKQKFSKREGSIINEDGISKLVRTDGTVTLIPKEFWEEASNIDIRELFRKIDDTYNTNFAWAKGDSVVKEEEYKNLLSMNFKKVTELPGNHEFLNNDNWNGLLEFLKNITRF
ncbi:alpha/beta hydrolase [Candidatus Dojkabacteria bacterium]|nr:alpha/beta hydrolase [Candidatus Dojkabacteria bacterium]